LQIAESNRTDRGADKFEDFTVDSFNHAAHLTIAALGDRKLQVRIFSGIADARDLRRSRGSVAERNAAA